MTGPTSVFEGSKGVVRAFTTEPALERLCDGLGERWLLDDLAFKFYNCCYFIHPAIDAVLELVRRHGLCPADVATLHVGTSTQGHAHVGRIPEPHDEVGAQFSLHFTLALVLLDGTPGLHAYSDDCLADPAIRDLARRVAVEDDAVATAEYPASWGSIVTAHTVDGRALAARVRNPRGTRENPCTIDDLWAKFHRNVTPALGAASAAGLRERLERLKRLPTIADLTQPTVVGENVEEEAPVAGAT